VRGSGTLILTRDSDFTLPRSRQRQTVRTLGGDHPYVTVTDPGPPAITVERGATLQYGDGGTTGLIGHFPYDTPAFRLNQDNIRVDGALRLSLKSAYNLGTVSGSGLITQPRFLWGTWDLSGTHSFSGVIDNGTQLNAGRPEYATSLPNVRKILNQGTFTVDTPPARTVTMGMDFYQREYGSDINVQSRPGGKVVLTGRYSWSDQGGDTDPSLSDPALNWTPAHKNVNKRGTDIKGADVRWGDGTTDEIFMPGTAETVYINLLAARSRSRLTFDYNGLRLKRPGDARRPHRGRPVPRHAVRTRRRGHRHRRHQGQRRHLRGRAVLRRLLVAVRTGRGVAGRTDAAGELAHVGRQATQGWPARRLGVGGVAQAGVGPSLRQGGPG
jgi:hypothetical protein